MADPLLSIHPTSLYGQWGPWDGCWEAAGLELAPAPLSTRSAPSHHTETSPNPPVVKRPGWHNQSCCEPGVGLDPHLLGGAFRVLTPSNKCQGLWWL